MQEELSLDIKTMQYIGTSRTSFYAMPWEGYFYEVKVEGDLRSNEEDTMDEFARVSFVPCENWL